MLSVAYHSQTVHHAWRHDDREAIPSQPHLHSTSIHTRGPTPTPNHCVPLQLLFFDTNQPTLQQLQALTNKELRHQVFNDFFQHWKTNHTKTLIGGEHSLLTCYQHAQTVDPTRLPSYLKVLNAGDATHMARLRFNRARLNQSLHKRARSNTDKCPHCPTEVESPEHLLLHCPRYAKARHDCHAAISQHMPYHLSLPSLLGSHDRLVSATSLHTAPVIKLLSKFINTIRQIRSM